MKPCRRLRWKRMYLLRKALLRGACAALRPTVGVRDVTNSVIAVPIYGLALPFAALLGQHRFMDLLVQAVSITWGSFSRFWASIR